MVGHKLLLGLGCLVVSWSACAETAYIIDKLLVGLHEDKALNSAIIKLLPTGTRLFIIKREGNLAQVKTPGGTTGWVDA